MTKLGYTIKITNFIRIISSSVTIISLILKLYIKLPDHLFNISVCTMIISTIIFYLFMANEYGINYIVLHLKNDLIYIPSGYYKFGKFRKCNLRLLKILAKYNQTNSHDSNINTFYKIDALNSYLKLPDLTLADWLSKKIAEEEANAIHKKIIIPFSMNELTWALSQEPLKEKNNG